MIRLNTVRQLEVDNGNLSTNDAARSDSAAGQVGVARFGGRRESSYWSGGWEIPAADGPRHSGIARPGILKGLDGYAEPFVHTNARECRMEAYRFMTANRTRWSISTMARVLGVSRRGYYAWRSRVSQAGQTPANAAFGGPARQRQLG